MGQQLGDGLLADPGQRAELHAATLGNSAMARFSGTNGVDNPLDALPEPDQP